MSDAHVPILTQDNYPRWALKVKLYLAPNDHDRVIRRMTPRPLEDDADELEWWIKSETDSAWPYD